MPLTTFARTFTTIEHALEFRSNLSLYPLPHGMLLHVYAADGVWGERKPLLAFAKPLAAVGVKPIQKIQQR